MRKVLVVDGSPVALDEMARLVEHPNVRILRARSAQEALDVHRNERMDLMFVARDMPDVDGLNMCRALRADADLRSVSIVLVGDDGDQRSAAREAGANAFIKRPLTRAELLRTMIKFLNVAPRRAVEVPVHMQLLGLNGAEPFEATSVNVSTSGMLAESAHRVDVGATVVCHFELPSTGMPLLFTAEVVRAAPASRPERHAYGVRFLRTDSNGLSALERFVGEA